MTENFKSISVVLPNYNGKHLLEKYIPSVYHALHHSQLDFEFIVVDDCSCDNSVEFITEHYPEIQLIKNIYNGGFSYTCNQGIKRASKDLVLLLNSDVELTPDYFEKQLSYFNLPDTFGVMGCIMNFDGKKIEDTARMPRFKGFKFKANRFYYVEDTDHLTLTCYLSGANALIDRKKLVMLNGFDEIYSPFYFEDFDLGLRAWKMGWSSYYEHKAICFHQISSSTNKLNKSNFVKIIYNRNSFILQSIHLNGAKRNLWYVQLFTLTLLGHFVKGDFWILKSLKQFLMMHTDIARSRHKNMQLQKQAGVNISLENIVDTIKNSIIGKKAKWL